MPEVSLQSLLHKAGVDGTIREDTLVSNIVYDSRQCRPGDLFVALPGFHTDGHRYIPQAVRAGARAVVHEHPFDPAWAAAGGGAAAPGGARRDAADERTRGVAKDGVAKDAVTTDGAAVTAGAAPIFLRVSDARRALSALADAFYGHPSRELCVVGVTGTDGKSTTVWFAYQLLRGLGVPAGFISTVALETTGTVIDNPWRQSTPEAPEIHRSLREMADAGKRVAVVEATSHGLSEKTCRLADVAFDVAVFTNLSHEHLEFHGSYEQYRSDKGNLFRSLSRSVAATGTSGPAAVINGDDGESEYYASLAGQAGVTRVLHYSIGATGADVSAFLSEMSPVSTTVLVDVAAGGVAGRDGGSTRRRATLPLPGWFNVSNALAAVLAVSESTGIPVEEVLGKVGTLTAVSGRLEPIESSAPFSVVVDYAHTPGSFEKVLPHFRETTTGRLIAVFGSAGERDVDKRSRQGEVAGHHCEVIVLTDEDPRGEDSSVIIDTIASGAETARNEVTGEPPEIHRVPDRRQAIRRAFEVAKTGDTVVLLGKGHEKSIIYRDGAVPWDEAKVAREVLADMGYTPA